MFESTPAAPGEPGFPALDMANLLGLPYLELAADRSLIKASTTGLQLFRADAPLSLVEQRVSPRRSEDLPAFERALGEARLSGPGSPEPIRFGPERGWPELLGLVRAFGTGWIMLAAEPRYRWSPIDGRFFRHWFGLTARESQLSEQLAAGGSLEEVAAKLDITDGTARTHVKNIFSKLDLSRQADLIYLLTLLRVAKPAATTPTTPATTG